jgi:hypothetical protein
MERGVETADLPVGIDFSLLCQRKKSFSHPKGNGVSQGVSTK